MVQNVIRDMGGIATYGVISILLFFSVFLGALLYALLQRRTFCERMCGLPLDDGSRETRGERKAAVEEDDLP